MCRQFKIGSISTVHKKPAETQHHLKKKKMCTLSENFKLICRTLSVQTVKTVLLTNLSVLQRQKVEINLVLAHVKSRQPPNTLHQMIIHLFTRNTNIDVRRLAMVWDSRIGAIPTCKMQRAIRVLFVSSSVLFGFYLCLCR